MPNKQPAKAIDILKPSTSLRPSFGSAAAAATGTTATIRSKAQ